MDDPGFMAELAEIAANKPANPDMYSTAYAEFVATFARVLGDPALPHLFFVEGGALAVENALKVAFDWKSRHNEAAGRDRRLGTRIMHLTRAFHGRSGYTLSLTNTEPNKTDRFPIFDWPRMDVPAMIFPLSDHLDEVVAAEQRALEQARRAFAAHPHDIAAFIAEPIQGEGGDNHIRGRSSSPRCARCRMITTRCSSSTRSRPASAPPAHRGRTSSSGCNPTWSPSPRRLSSAGSWPAAGWTRSPGNVFQISGRINSTWGGGLVDMVRCRRLLEIIEAQGLIEAAGPKGALLVAGLERVREEIGVISNVRGRGLFVACDLPDTAQRDRLVTDLRKRERVILLPCGERSIRFRPALSVEDDEIDEAVGALARSLTRLAGKEMPV